MCFIKIYRDRIPQDKIPTDEIPTDKIPQDQIPQDKIPQYEKWTKSHSMNGGENKFKRSPYSTWKCVGLYTLHNIKINYEKYWVF